MELKDGKYKTQLRCINCGELFGDFTIMKASETLLMCDECRATKRKAKR